VPLKVEVVIDVPEVARAGEPGALQPFVGVRLGHAAGEADTRAAVPRQPDLRNAQLACERVDDWSYGRVVMDMVVRVHVGQR
jgi:hypothetical protein